MKRRADTTADLDLFSPAPEENSVSESRLEVIPVNISLPNGDVNTPLEFRVPSAPDWYTDISPTILEVHMKIQFASGETEADKAIPKTKQIGLINNALMSMFSGVSVQWNNQVVLSNNNCLPWTAYLDVLSQFSYDARKSWLSASGWYDGGLGSVSPQAIKAFQPFFENGTGHFIGPIQLDFCRMRKYILPGIEMIMRLFRQDPSFFIISEKEPGKTETYKVLIERAYLHVRRVKLTETAQNIINNHLQKSDAIYEFMDTIVKPIIVPENVFSIDVNLYDGVLPSRLDIVQLTQGDYTGPASYGPFYFRFADMKSVTLEKNGILVAPPYQCDFRKSNYARMFLDYFKNSGCSLDRAGMSEISYDNYKDGYTIMSFNLERFDECYTNLKASAEKGSLRLKIEYDIIPASINLRPLVILCLFKFKRTYYLDSQRMLTQEK